MNASSLSGECARFRAAVIGEAAGVDMSGLVCSLIGSAEPSYGFRNVTPGAVLPPRLTLNELRWFASSVERHVKKAAKDITPTRPRIDSAFAISRREPARLGAR